MNTLKGKIVAVQSSDIISLISIDVDGDILSSIILEGKRGPVTYGNGDPVNLLFKETEVGTAKNLSGMISFRNRFPAQIKKIEKGALLARIRLDYKGKRIESIISVKSADDMKLQENENVEWLVKTNEVSLLPIPK